MKSLLKFGKFAFLRLISYACHVMNGEVEKTNHDSGVAGLDALLGVSLL